MLSNYDPNVNAAICFLKQLKIKVNNATVNDTLLNHPDWPSLLCVSDSLSKWNTPNGAGKIDTGKIDELPTPFIAYTNNRVNPLAIVTSVENGTIGLFQKSYSKAYTEDKESFLKKWNGVYLIAEKTEHSGEKKYALHRRTVMVNSLIPVSLSLLLVTLSVIFLYDTISRIDLTISVWGICLQYILLLAGVFIAFLLLWYEIDKNNPVLKKVCTGIVKGDCNAILTGRQSKVFSWLSWSEVGFFYFAGGLLVLLFSGSFLSNAITLIALFNILALPYPVFSIYYQWKVAKQWCILCLSVQAMLLLGALNIYINGLINFSFNLPLPFLLNAAMLYLLPVLLWFTIKPAILNLQQSKNTKREYLRLKFNSEIFETLLKKQAQITLSTEGLGIILGKQSAENTLIKICNPYCGPCSKAHEKIEKLLDDNIDLKVQIIFTTPNIPGNDAYKPVSHLLAIKEKNADEITMKKALDDWYLSDKKDYNAFAAKYPMNGELSKQGNKIAAMENWCKAMEVQATPTIFINGYKLPDAYSIEDLQYFLLA